MDADGSIVSHYRKSHIPDGPGYQEKFYFSPGDTGFRVSKSRYATIGVAICWDQWFPEAARVLTLKGAEILFYPTAIGSEPMSELDSRHHWRRTMQDHSAANMVPVVTSNRTGKETGQACSLEFYGSSFITDEYGDVVEQATFEGKAVLTATFDLSDIAVRRTEWGLFRDRRRYPLVSDTQGALLMLLETSSGDPDDDSPVDNSWLWAELWSNDPADSASFYQAVVGYKSKSIKDASGDDVLLLGSGSYRTHVSYGPGYRGYYGARPWGYYPGYVGRPIDPDWGVDPGGPVATPLPDMGGMDMGMGMGMDMGGFDF